MPSPASMVCPESTRYAVRQRPIRRVMLTVPPAPGIRPRLSSGRPSVAPGRHTTRAAERRHLQAAAEHLTVHLGAARRTQPCGSARRARAPGCAGCGPGARWRGRRRCRTPRDRLRCRMMGRCRRAPPRSTPGSTRATVKRLEQCRPGVGGERVVPLRSVESRRAGCCRRGARRTGSGISGTRAGPRSVSQRANSGPDCNVEYASDSVITPASAGAVHIDGAQHVVAHRRGMRPAFAPRSANSVQRRRAPTAPSPCAGRRSSASTSVKVARCSQYSDSGAYGSPTPTTTAAGAVHSGPVGGSDRSTTRSGGHYARILVDQALLVQLAGVGARQLGLERDRPRTLVVASADPAATPAVLRRTRRWRRPGRRSAPRP